MNLRGPSHPDVDAALADLRARAVIPRIWAHDHTVWAPDPAEIANRLGWLHCPETMPPRLGEIASLVGEVRSAGFTHALLLGMGGSSLAPEVLRRTLGVRPGFLDLAVLDSTDPGAVRAAEERAPLDRTLFVVATKSGGTVETFSFFKHFYRLLVDRAGAAEAGRRFVAITDPGSGLADIAAGLGFRATFLNDPDIGGRFSALSLFGLVPAALMGIDPADLLDSARSMSARCRADGDRIADNPGAHLGAILGAAALAGRDKLTLAISPALASLGVWIEQLVAESTGKHGRGILPVVDEALGPSDAYGDDRLFVHIRLARDTTHVEPLRNLAAAGHPVVEIPVDSTLDLGGELFLWEMATAVACWRIGVNPFDQPDVEAAKVQGRAVVARYRAEGALPAMVADAEIDGIGVFGAVDGSTAASTRNDGSALPSSIVEVVDRYVADARPGDYIAIQAYLPPGEGIEAALDALRTHLRDLTGCAVTVGFGPRFLHSTGQLHKGDRGNGRFIQLTREPGADDVPIPDEADRPESTITFGVLALAQALGDGEALRAAGRRVLRLHLGAGGEGKAGLEKVLRRLAT